MNDERIDYERLERLYLAEAERLLEARAKKTGTPARKLINRVFNEPDEDPKPRLAREEAVDIAAELSRRLNLRSNPDA